MTLVVEYQAKDRLHVEILPRYLGPQNETWFILPEELVPKAGSDHKFDARNSDLELLWVEEPTFSFMVKRKATGDVLFNTAGSKLVFEDQFFELTTQMPENYNTYGLGEVIHPFRNRNNVTSKSLISRSSLSPLVTNTREGTLWNVDALCPIGRNLYGSHPVYLDTRYFDVDTSGQETYAADASDKSKSYVSYTHGVYLRNAHGLEVLLRDSSITWRGLGGTLDFYFYSGPNAHDVMRAYQTTTVGVPFMPPYWSLGYHQCRFGYQGWKNLKEVMDGLDKAKIPVDTIWGDINYMDHNRDFTTNPITWGEEEGAEFLDWIHETERQFIPIVDGSIYVPDRKDPDDVYPTFGRGMSANAFIKNPDGSLYIGRATPGWAAFPDWVGATIGDGHAFEFWAGEFSIWHEKIPFDGIWIDMNEVSSFCDGSCGSEHRHVDSTSAHLVTQERPPQKPLHVVDPVDYLARDEVVLKPRPSQRSRNLLNPPYKLNNFLGRIDSGNVAGHAKHHGGTVEYDFHNIWGYQSLNATYGALKGVFPGKRPFIIGRSTFAGSGRWAGHWGGDNWSWWEYLHLSIPQALSFSIFGIPMFGVDACGFLEDTTGELCARWMQLGAFFGFYRNHNMEGSASQEPYLWPEVAEASRNAMRIRYALLPYLYTLFYEAHVRGDTVMRALAWEFPNDPSLADFDRQFMLGPAIMVAPVLEEGATSVHVYFPCGAKWYDWYSLTEAVKGTSTSGRDRRVEAPVTHIPVFIRGGSVIPMQQPGLTTRASRRGKWELIVALDEIGEAVGELYMDDGESIEPEATLFVKVSLFPFVSSRSRR